MSEEAEVQRSPERTIVKTSPMALSERDPMRIAHHLTESGMFPQLKGNVSRAVVLILAGEAVGLDPIAAVQGITLIEGKVGYMGNVLATLLRQDERYDYRIVARDDEGCTLQFLRDGAPFDDDAEGKVTFTVADAERAELVKPRSNWIKYPRAMCFNRALTEGVRAYCPDLTAGTPAYTDGELTETVTETVIDAEVVEESEAPVVEDSPALPIERVESLITGIRVLEGELAAMPAANGWLDGLNIILGSIGASAFGPGEIEGQLARLSEEQADALDAELQRMAEPEGSGPPAQPEQGGGGEDV